MYVKLADQWISRLTKGRIGVQITMKNGPLGAFAKTGLRYQHDNAPCGGPDLKGSCMIAFGKRKGGGRRSAARSTAPLIAVFTTCARSRSAIIADVSSSGVRLRGPDLPKMGEDLVVAMETVEAFGSVVWSDHGECGIAFDQPLALESEQLLQSKVRLARELPLDIQAAFDNWIIGSGR